jgi:hypothetical protein
VKARWPGAAFHFRPDSLLGAPGAITEPRRALLELLFMIGGRPPRLSDERLRSSSPLHLVAWAKSAGRQILAAMAADVGALVADAPRDGTDRFRGSNEAGTSLALKALAATWAKRRAPKAPIRFEERKEEVAAEGLARECTLRRGGHARDARRGEAEAHRVTAARPGMGGHRVGPGPGVADNSVRRVARAVLLRRG